MGSSKWAHVTDWYIDPAQTYGGNDENDGLTSSTPIESIAEWRRRVQGARFTSSAPTIHAMSSSTVKDDGLFYGFTCEQQTIFVKLMATPTVIGTGTVTAYTAYSGNTRGSLTDSGMSAASWTAAGWVTTTAGSRFIRKAGTGARAYAPVLLDLGSKTAQLGVANNLDETAFPLQPSITEVNFTVGDSYEIVTMPSWPDIQPGPLVDVGVKCMDMTGVLPTTQVGVKRYQLCGFTGSSSVLQPCLGGGFLAYNSVYCVSGPNVQFTGYGWFVANCSFLNANVVAQFGGPDLNVNGEINVFVNSPVTFSTAARVSLGSMRFYDCTSPLITAQYGAGLNITHTVVGSGNSGALLSCHDGSKITGASVVTASTTALQSYIVNSVQSSVLPAVDSSSGDAIYA